VSFRLAPPPENRAEGIFDGYGLGEDEIWRGMMRR
jgi:hypothetical protein